MGGVVQPTTSTMSRFGARGPLVAGGPGEQREVVVLGSHQGKSIALILDKLGGGQMPGPAQLGRFDDLRCRSLYWLGQQHRSTPG